MKHFFKSVNDSLTLLSFRYSKMSSLFKWGSAILLSFLVLALIMANSINSLIRVVNSSRARTDSAGELAQESLKQAYSLIDGYFQVYLSNELTSFYVTFLLLLLGPLVFSALSNYITHGVISNVEMIAVKDNDDYKIGDSVVFQYFSAFSFLQLIGLISIGRLLTFDAPHGSNALLLFIGLWSLTSLLTSVLYWTIEYIQRKLSNKTRIAIVALLTLSTAIILLLAWNEAQTLFGLAPALQKLTEQVSQGNTQLLVLALMSILILHVCVIYALMFIAKKTLLLPERIFIKQRKQHKFNVGSQLSPLQLTGLILARYSVLIRPVVTVLLFSLVFILGLGGKESITSTSMIIPLAIVVSFGANFFGLLGSSVNWLLALSHWRFKIINTAIAFIFGIILVSYAVLYSIGLLTHKIELAQVIHALPQLLTIGIISTILSLFLSFRNPLPFSGKARENLVSSPTLLLQYTFGLLFVLAITTSILEYLPTPVLWIVVGVLTLISGLLYLYMLKAWVLGEKLTKKLLEQTINIG